MKLYGNSKVLNNLEYLTNGDHGPNTYIFSGPEHVGKKIFAHLFLNSLIKRQTLEKVQISQMHPDILCLERSDDISVDDARKVRSFLSFSPLTGSRKGILIDNAHLLGTVGSNLLLKSLEEPPHETFTVLVTHRPDLLPKTIISRATTIRFSTVSNSEIANMVPKGKLTQIKKELPWIAGRPGLLIKYLKDPKDADIQTLKYFFNLSASSNLGQLIKIAEKVSKEEKPHIALEGLFLAQWYSGNERNRISLSSLIKARETILNTNANIRLCVENALLSYN